MSLFQDGTEVQCFVAQSMDQVVGVALLRREEVKSAKVWFIKSPIDASPQFLYKLFPLVMSVLTRRTQHHVFYTRSTHIKMFNKTVKTLRL